MQYNKVLAPLCLGMLLAFCACKRETKDERFKSDLLEFTQKECPKYIDPCTQLDSVYYNIETRTLTYYYTVQDFLDNDSLYTDEVVEGFREDVLKGLKSSIQMKPYKDEGITICYRYRSTTTGKQLLKLTFEKEDYSK